MADLRETALSEFKHSFSEWEKLRGGEGDDTFHNACLKLIQAYTPSSVYALDCHGTIIEIWERVKISPGR